MVTYEELISKLYYCPHTGLFTWLTGHLKGRHAGNKDNVTGYIRIKVNNKMYLAHRLAYLYMNGEHPSLTIDHIDREPSNNKWLNLRLCSQTQNNLNRDIQKNNTSGYVGIQRSKTIGKWEARVKRNGKTIHLGTFNCITSARMSRELYLKTI